MYNSEYSRGMYISTISPPAVSLRTDKCIPKQIKKRRRKLLSGRLRLSPGGVFLFFFFLLASHDLTFPVRDTTRQCEMPRKDRRDEEKKNGLPGQL
jgi:hypothetical protein